MLKKSCDNQHFLKKVIFQEDRPKKLETCQTNGKVRKARNVSYQPKPAKLGILMGKKQENLRQIWLIHKAVADDERFGDFKKAEGGVHFSRRVEAIAQGLL